MAGIATGERIPGETYQAIVERAAVGDPIARIAKTIGVTWHTAKAVVTRESREIDLRKRELLDQSLRIARRAANTIERNITDQTPLPVLVPIYGVAVDKIHALSPPQPVDQSQQHLHLHLESQDLAATFNKLLGSLQHKAKPVDVIDVNTDANPS